MKKLIWIAALGLIAPFANAEMPAAADAPADETTAAAATFEQVDSDQDGMISKQEASSFSAVELIFDSADANQDGALDAGEFSQAQQPAAESAAE